MNIEKYDYIVAYGIGQYYEVQKDRMFKKIQPDYLCDKKWEGEKFDCYYDGIKIIRIDELIRLDNVLLIIFASSKQLYKTIVDSLHLLDWKGKWECVPSDVLFSLSHWIDGKMLKEKYTNGNYKDDLGNVIEFDLSIPDTIEIFFNGRNNKVILGKELNANRLSINLGNNATCVIGMNFRAVEVSILVSEGLVSIGNDCLLSDEIIIRNHDNHHIFDIKTGKRVNWSKNIVVENNVWIGQRVMLLAGTHIGMGSVVGAGAITTGSFDQHTIIAGVPAKVIRENICWSRDNTNFFNRGNMTECISNEFLKYI